MNLNSIRKKMFKLRSFLIRLISGKDITVIINAKLDAEKGIVIDKAYNVINNVEANGFNYMFTCKAIETTIENKNVKTDLL